MTEHAQRPHKTLKLGYIRAAIWKNANESGTFYGVTFERVYKADDGSWKSAYSYGREDLLSLAKLADTAHTEVNALVQADREASSSHDAAQHNGDQPSDGSTEQNSGPRRPRGGRGREGGR